MWPVETLRAWPQARWRAVQTGSATVAAVVGSLSGLSVIDRTSPAWIVVGSGVLVSAVVSTVMVRQSARRDPRGRRG